MVRTRSGRNTSGRRTTARPIAKYNSNDWSNRHRLPDRKQKDVNVITYTRRKPGVKSRRSR